MPSDEIGRGSPDHASALPPGNSLPAASSRPPAWLVAWGPVRDAITAIHNLETLLKSPRVGVKTLADVLPEVWAGAAVIRAAFSSAAAVARTDAALVARAGLVQFSQARLDDLEGAMRSASGDFDARTRLSMQQVATRVSADLDACIELLDLAERSEHALPTELALEELARVSMQNKARGVEREIAVRFARHHDDCVLSADPHVFKRLVAFAVARAHAAGAPSATLHVRSDTEYATIEIAATVPAELALPPLPMRLLRRIDPTDAVVEAASASAAIDSRIEGSTITLSVARAH